MSVEATFGGPLLPDPEVALPVLDVQPAPGPHPLHKIQYVVEIAGPHTLPAQSAKLLLDPRWHQGLGSPDVFVMSQADERWRHLKSDDPAGAFDSLALAWDLITPQGSLTRTSAEHLLQVAEQFASQIERRAFAMPTPDMVEDSVRRVQAVIDNLDIGVSVYVHPDADSFRESEIWKACAALGLQYGPSGLFEWRVPNWEWPLLGVGPMGDASGFTLGQAQGGAEHPGVDIGFHVPVSPDPARALEGCFHVARVLANRLGGQPASENDELLNDHIQNGIRSQLKQALTSFHSAGLAPGSPEALKLFL